jgi:predicted phosphodiesterase
MAGVGPDKIFEEFAPELRELGCNVKGLANWVYKYDDDKVQSVRERLGKVADLLEKSGISLDQIGKVQSVRLSEWQGLTKDGEGNAELHDLTGSSIVLSPSWDDGPAWPVVQQCKPTLIKPLVTKGSGPKVTLPNKATGKGWQTAVVLPDTQFGFWRDIETGTLNPFHDERALAVTLKAIAELQPELVILLGDVLDMPEHSRFDQEPGFAMTTQAALDRAHMYLAEIRANAPSAEIRYIEGNHDRRLQLATIRNAKASFGLRQANATPDSWPVLSVPFLLRLDELGIDYIPGYPAGITWINRNICCVHGSKVRSSGSTAAAVIDEERVSIVFGHVHRIEFQSKTRRVYADDVQGNIKGKHSFAATPGCLCRIDGTVPSTKGSTDPFGKPVPAVENWSQGFALVTYEPGDGRFAYEPIAIYDGEAVMRGKVLVA